MPASPSSTILMTPSLLNLPPPPLTTLMLPRRPDVEKASQDDGTSVAIITARNTSIIGLASGEVDVMVKKIQILRCKECRRLNSYGVFGASRRIRTRTRT